MASIKQIIVAPLASLFVVPGLGQLINGQAKKACILIGAVFLQVIVFVISTVRLFKGDPRLMEMLQSGQLDLSFMTGSEAGLLPYLLLLMALTWAFGFLDALYFAIKVQGRKLP